MPIVKIKPRGNFTVIPNGTLRDNRLSIWALGLLAYLLSQHDSFKLSFKLLQKKFNIGRDKMSKIARELKENGYLQHVALQNETGGFDGQEWYVYAVSQNVNFRLTKHNRPTKKPSDVKTVSPENRQAKNQTDKEKQNSSQKKNTLEKKKKEINPLPETGVIFETSSLIKKGSKPKREESPEFVEFRKKLADFQNSYAEPTKTGHIIENSKSIRQLFDLARGDSDICIEMHYSQQTEGWRKGRVDWITVLSNFNFYLANKKGEQNGIIQNNSGHRETDRQQRDREAKQRNETFGELNRILDERDRVLQGEGGANHQ